MQDNPYASPAAQLRGEQTSSVHHFGDATQGQRLANVIIDNVGIFVAMFVCGIVLALAGAASVLKSPVGGYAVSLSVMFAYYVGFELLFGRTPGKLITGTRVLTSSGAKAGFLQILGRTAARFIPFEPFSFLGAETSGWHDRMSGTRVVRLRPTKWQEADEV